MSAAGGLNCFVYPLAAVADSVFIEKDKMWRKNCLAEIGTNQ